jgi:hypothetical protein
MAYIGNDVDAIFIPESVNTSTSLRINGGGLTQTGGDVNFDSGTLFIDEDTNRVGIGTIDPQYTLDFGKTSASTIRLISEHNGTAIRVGAGGGDNNVTLLRVDGEGVLDHDGESDSAAYGFSIKYMGGRLGNNNSLSIFSDNQEGSQIEAVTISQDGNVGIGTDNPQEKLEIEEGNIRLSTDIGGTVPKYAINWTGGGAGQVAVFSANTSTGEVRMGADNSSGTYFTTLYSNGDERLRITSTGNVGIGTDNPIKKVDIRASAVTAARLQVSSGGYNWIELASDDNSGNLSVSVNDRSGGGGTGSFGINQYDVNGSYARTPIVVSSTGNVGIGTINPASKLHVYGGSFSSSTTLSADPGDYAISVESATGSYTSNNIGHNIAFRSNSGQNSGRGRVVAAINTVDRGTQDASALTFNTANTSEVLSEQVRIDINGNVGIGSTNPAQKLDVGGNVRLGTLSAAGDFTDSGSTGTRHLTIGADNGGDALLVTHASGYGVGYFGYEAGGDRLIIACDSGGGNNKIDFSVNAGTTANGATDNINGIAPAMRIAASGNVGIGTNNPEGKLVVSNGSTGLEFNPNNAQAIVSYNRVTSAYAPNGLQGSTIGLYIGGVGEALRITSTGNVGIGTDNTYNIKLFVRKNDATTYSPTNFNGHTHTFLDNATNGGYTNLILGCVSATTGSSCYAGIAVVSENASDTNGALTIGTRGPGGPNVTEKVRVTSSGNVGIGTDNPSQKLQIYGSDSQYISIISSDSGNTGVLFGDSDRVDSGYILYGNSSDTLILGTGGNISGSGTGKLTILSGGNVGIGTDNPAVKLDVDGSLQLRAAGNYTTYATRIYSRLDSTHCSVIESYLNNSTAFEMMGSYADAGGSNPRVVISAGGQKVGIGVINPSYNLEVNGSFAATTKSFIIDHPTKEGYKLRHGSLEGPENGVYVRGRSTETIISLPDYWVALVDPDSITVSLTPIGPSGAPRVERIENNKVYIFSEDSRPLDYFYMVNAERVDVDPLEIEIPSTN